MTRAEPGPSTVAPTRVRRVAGALVAGALLMPWATARAQDDPSPTRAEEASVDPRLIALEGRLSQGFSLSTARELARRLSVGADPATPQVVLLAARAHAEARSWAAVQRLLRERDWLDTFDDGAGRVLLARAYLALGDPLLGRPPGSQAGDGPTLTSLTTALPEFSSVIPTRTCSPGLGRRSSFWS